MMAPETLSARGRYYNRFISELDGRVQAILGAAAMLRGAGIATLPDDQTEVTAPLVSAVEDIYRQAHSIRGVAGTLGLEPARDAADIMAETALHLNEDGMLADSVVWDLIVQTANALVVFGAACQKDHNPEASVLASEIRALRATFDSRFAPPEDATDDFLEVARVLRLTDDEIAAYRFPTQESRHHEEMSRAAQVEQEALAGTMPGAEHDLIYVDAQDAAIDEAAPVTDITLEDANAVDLASGEADWLPAAHAEDAESQADTMALSAAEALAESGQIAHAAVLIDTALVAPAPVVPRASRMLTIFCQSSSRLLELVPPALRRIEDNRWDQSAMRTARRVFHTIKGDGRQAGQTEVASLAEAAEDVFDAIFDAREATPEANHGVPLEALPLLLRAHQTLAALFIDPERLVGKDGGSYAEQIDGLVAVAQLVGGAASAGVSAGRTELEERRQRLLPAFLAESRRQCDQLHEHIGILTAEPADIQALLGSARALHTLKGNASTMNQDTLVALASAGESLLEQVVTSGESVSRTQIGLLSDLDGALRHVIDAIDHEEPQDRTALSPLLAELTAKSRPAQTQDVVPTLDTGTATTDLGPVPLSLTQVRFAQRPAGNTVPTPPAKAEPSIGSADTAPRPIFMPRSSSEPERARAQRRSLTESITSVDLGEVDRTIDLFGRLVTSRTMIARGIQDLERPAGESIRNGQRLRTIIEKVAAEFELVRRERRAATQRDGWDPVELETFDSFTQIMLELGEIIADQEEIADSLREGVRRGGLICENDEEATDELQRALLGFRLVRINTISPRLDQVITSTARAVGKQVSWRLHGGDIAVDKAVLDAMQEPLLHLLRNAIDHGIESVQDREARGKQPGGTIAVEASYGANSVIITVVDDGGGIDPERIAASAVARGVLSAEAANALDDRAKLNLIWQPGFSTAAAVTDISGRGVGLDIVRNAIARVRGSVTMESSIGRGTRFSLTLPLSLSVARTLLLRDGTSTVAAPITQIEGVHLVSVANITALPDRTVAMIEGRSVTLLAQGLGQSIPLAERLTGEQVTILEVRQGGERTSGFVIDEVLGEEDTLVKALPGYLAHRSVFVGCSVAGDGRPYAIVDLRQLADQSGGSSSAQIGTPLLSLARAASRAVQPLVLVVDDSVFMRRSLAEVYAGAGFRVETAEDGEAALGVIARLGMPALISLDMEMPRMNGMEMLAVLRQLPGGQAVPVFMITTRGQERHRKAALSAGVTRYFIKPFDNDDLLAAARDQFRAPLISIA
jgi:chemotaxis protein histidine kinase CheA/ActR/RegA family two-component response regulator